MDRPPPAVGRASLLKAECVMKTSMMIGRAGGLLGAGALALLLGAAGMMATGSM